MPLTTINLNSYYQQAEIAILNGIHHIEPIGWFKDSRDGDLFVVFANNDETSNILKDVKQAEEDAQKLGDPCARDIVWSYIEDCLARNMPQIKDVIVGIS